jgi:hypothetical protein
MGMYNLSPFPVLVRYFRQSSIILETISKPAAKIIIVAKGDIRLLVTPILTFPRQWGRDF